MTEIVSRLTEVENLLRHLPAAKRTMLLKAITDLFLENVDRYGPAQIVLFDRLFTQLVADAGGRVYFAKDSRLRPDLVPVMYPRLDRLRDVRARVDPSSVLQSDLARRLGLL